MFGFIGDMLGLNAGKATQKAANQNKGLLGDFKTEGMGYIDKGTTQGAGYLEQANDLYSPLAALGQKGGALYADGLGINGADGNTRATTAFQEGPGYQHTLGQGLQALDRSASARGNFQSGGAEADTMTFASGLASQEYGSWLDRLGNPGTIINSAIPGKVGALGSLADLYTGAASKKVNMADTITSGLMGANNQVAMGKEKQAEGLAGLGKNLLKGVVGGGWF